MAHHKWCDPLIKLTFIDKYYGTGTLITDTTNKLWPYGWVVYLFLLFLFVVLHIWLANKYLQKKNYKQAIVPRRKSNASQKTPANKLHL